MTAEEIRKAKFETDSGSWECARWLQEIAAQLAEMNETLIAMRRDGGGE